jgi:hypothetical protein
VQSLGAARLAVIVGPESLILVIVAPQGVPLKRLLFGLEEEVNDLLFNTAGPG